MNDEIRSKLTAKDKWMRALFMLLFCFINSIIKVFVWIIAIVQFGFSLLTDKPNDKLSDMGNKISEYSFHIMRYLTFNVDDKPYPFSDKK